MNIRKSIYLNYSSLRGYQFTRIYKKLVTESNEGIHQDTTKKLLIQILTHCQKNVPYYADMIGEIGGWEQIEEHPELYLSKLTVLTKDIIRNNFEELKSKDLEKRQHYFNTSGGSTGEPIKLVQDKEFADWSAAITAMYSYWVGRDIGETEVILWGSERDVFEGTMGWKANFFNFLNNVTYVNAFQMNSQKMREFIQIIDKKHPKLILAYVQSIYELAKFAEQEKIEITPQRAIITSAGTLYPWMREKIESVFQCRVFNRYGSREVSDIACERPGYDGLWAAPWGNYIEIVDDDNNLVPAGVEGNILITSLRNYAMPLIRYQIGDRGILSDNNSSGQILTRVSGRNVDTFKTEDGTLIDGEYFTHLLYFKDWVYKFQIVQKSYTEIIMRIIKSESDFQEKELNDIVTKCQVLMGKNCKIKFEFIDDIPSSSSGKFRYTVSEVD
jgi:phenylacetate-CoA ligase